MKTGYGSPARNIMRLMNEIRLVGGRPLHGSVAVLGAKNAVLKQMVATLLAPGRHVLGNVPGILDVRVMAEVLEHAGATCEFDGTDLAVDVPEAPHPEAPLELVRRMRAWILILGVLLARRGEARVALPGGDDFGSRPIDMHLDGLEAMGVEFRLDHGVLEAVAPDGLHGAEVPLDFPSVGATENVLMAAVLAEGTTLITNAAREPELSDLVDMLVKMGAKIDGAGTSTIEVHGVTSLQPTSHRVIPDRLEAGTYALAGAISGGTMAVPTACPTIYGWSCANARRRMHHRDRSGHHHGDRPRPARPGRFATLPFPGFHTDMHPQMVAFLSVADGTSLLTENVYESASGTSASWAGWAPTSTPTGSTS